MKQELIETESRFPGTEIKNKSLLDARAGKSMTSSGELEPYGR
jgi:hypothetical protein